MFLILQVFYSLLSGVLLALAIPNEFLTFGSPLIGIFSLAPLYISLYCIKSYRQVFLLFFINACTTHLISSFWLSNFQGFALFTLGASCLGTGFIKALCGLIFFIPFAEKKEIRDIKESSGLSSQAPAFRTIWFTSFYVVYEWIKSTGFLAYPWGTLSMTAYRWPLMTQIADITGVYGITFMFAFFSACFGEAILFLGKSGNTEKPKENFRSIMNSFSACLLLLTTILVYGGFSIKMSSKPIKHMNTVLVQQNKDPWAKDEDSNILLSERLTDSGITAFQEKGKTCDLIVWSEAVLSKRFPEAELFYNFLPEQSPLLRFVDKTDIPFVIGGPVTKNKEKREFMNSALLFDRKGHLKGSYSKMHLVPFAELIPGRNLEIVKRFLKKIVGFSYGWTPGSKIVLFEIPVSSEANYGDDFSFISITENKNSVTISTPICFDDSANEVCRAMFLCGSEVFVNLTNDSWSKTKSAEIQHFVVAHFRAIEYRTTLVRATNSGFTTVIDNCGRIIDSLPLFEEASLAAEVPVYPRKLTVYAVFGNWLPILLLILSLSYIILRKRS